jgi:acetyl esterase/lipase
LNAQNLAGRRGDGGASAAQLSGLVDRADHVVDEAAGVVVRVHRPKDAVGVMPCLYFMHGGGFVMGSMASSDYRLDGWCAELGCVGVSVEYRLAPETPYPGPLEDCYAGLAWIHEHAEQLQVHVGGVGLAGDSAGGGLAAGLALLARDRGELPPASFELLVYPMLDDRLITSSIGWDFRGWDRACAEFVWGAYLGDLAGTDRVPPYAAPSRAENLVGLPPTLVCVGALDFYLDEGVDYTMRLMRSGVATELHVYERAPHGFDMVPNATVAQRCRRDMVDWLRRHLAIGQT